MSTPESAPLPDETPAPAPDTRRWWWRMLGLKRRQGKFIRFGLTKWGWFVFIFIFGGGGMAAFAEYSMTPDFCRSCHIMEPYVAAWHESKHKNVACVDCHFEPGVQATIYGKFQASSQAVKYLTHTYGSKPHAEVQDASCLRSGCHEKRLLEGKVNWPVTTERGNTVNIRFDHTPHLTLERRGQQLRCVSCHSQIVQGQHIVVTMDTCFLCHFKGIKHGRDDQTIGTCKGCHDAPKGEIRMVTGVFDHKDYAGRGVLCENCHSDSVKGDGNVPRQVCWNCHNQSTQVARFDETQAMHTAHVSEHKVECSGCHVKIAHNLTAGSLKIADYVGKGHQVSGDNGMCGLCHEQMHGGPLELFAGVGGRGVPDMPSPMFRAQVDCIACHYAKKQGGDAAEVIGQTYVAKQERCDYCHGDKYKGALDDWRKTVAAQTIKAEGAYATAKAAIDKTRLAPESDLEARRLLDDANHNINLVKLGHGVHNVTYSTAVLNVALDNCAKIGKIVAEKGAVSARP